MASNIKKESKKLKLERVKTEEKMATAIDEDLPSVLAYNVKSYIFVLFCVNLL